MKNKLKTNMKKNLKLTMIGSESSLEVVINPLKIILQQA